MVYFKCGCRRAGAGRGGGHFAIMGKGNSGRYRVLVDVNVRESEGVVRRRRGSIGGVEGAGCLGRGQRTPGLALRRGKA